MQLLFLIFIDFKAMPAACPHLGHVQLDLSRVVVALGLAPVYCIHYLGHAT